jgi:hypothetical protein
MCPKGTRARQRDMRGVCAWTVFGCEKRVVGGEGVSHARR